MQDLYFLVFSCIYLYVIETWSQHGRKYMGWNFSSSKEPSKQATERRDKFLTTPWPRPSVSHRSTQIDTDDFCPADLAEVTGKQHKDVMRAIRNMEPAWEKVNGRKFALVEYRDKKGELRPCYSLTKTECLSQIYTDWHGWFLSSRSRRFSRFLDEHEFHEYHEYFLSSRSRRLRRFS